MSPSCLETDWHALTDAAQARLRYALMREMAWFDWDGRPAWWWRKEHATLLELKRTAAQERHDEH